jgi:enterochelin esterase-like enzyme
MTLSFGRCLLAGLALCVPIVTQERQDVRFRIQPGPLAQGHSVYVLGSLPELGGNDLTRALKLVDTGSGWTIDVSLPVNASYTYGFYDREHDPSKVGLPSNGVPIGAQQNGSTAVVQLAPTRKRALVHTDFSGPLLFWRQGGGAFTSVSMVQVGPGRTPAEGRFEVATFASARQSVEFYLTDATQTRRDPATGSYETPLDAFFLQDGHLFVYVPHAAVTGHRRDYNQASPPFVTSAILNSEKRPYRVMLPRGYDQHTSRRYPVLYAHDGWLWFDDGASSVDRDAANLAELTRLGKVGEMIVVGIDPVDRTDPRTFWTTRYRDFTPPGDFGLTPFGIVAGAGDKYAAFVLTELKPVIDGQYRTRPSRDQTWTCGFSAGGVASTYFGWDFNASFSRAGAFSGQFETPAFIGRIQSGAHRDLRYYLDSGTVNDFYAYALSLYDDLIRKAAPWVVERELRFAYGLGHSHNTVDVGKRFPGFLEFLYPGTEARNEHLCGAVPYSMGLGGGQILALAWTSPGGPIGVLDVTGGAGGSVGVLGFSVAPGLSNFGNVPIVIQLGASAVTIPMFFDPTGRAQTPFDLRLPSIAGLSLFTQGFELRGINLFSSNGLELRMCR